MSCKYCSIFSFQTDKMYIQPVRFSYQVLGQSLIFDNLILLLSIDVRLISYGAAISCYSLTYDVLTIGVIA